jgi:hypothetical protein
LVLFGVQKRTFGPHWAAVHQVPHFACEGRSGPKVRPLLLSVLQVLAALATRRNQIPLPEVNTKQHGIRLPREEAGCLIAPVYDLERPVKKSQGVAEPSAAPVDGAASGAPRRTVFERPLKMKFDKPEKGGGRTRLGTAPA